MKNRSSGILLHITSLPSIFGIGDFGPSCYKFVDFLKDSKQHFWQVLPLNPTDTTYGNSPYSSPSAFAGNPLLISPEIMIEEGYLSNSDIMDLPEFPDGRVDFEAVSLYKTALLKKAYESNIKAIAENPDFKSFCTDNKDWLDDYCLYTSIKSRGNFQTWNKFPIGLRDRNGQSLCDWQEKEEDYILYQKFIQHIFFKQWISLKEYANNNGIEIIGDMPYYVNYDSSDVWINQDIFKLDENKKPEFIAGVPPDYFSETGQLWGNPVYDWDKMKETEYSWFLKRIGHNLSMFNKLRLDHFRGFVSYWEVKAGESTALNGKWINVDVESFFDTLFSQIDKSKFIAEDLGIITEEVKKVIKHYELPGMKILLFAFGNDYPYGDYLPKNIDNNCVIYTGTHDNNTVLGWWNDEAEDAEKNRVSEYLEKDINESNLNWELIELAMSSRADNVIIPMQDLLSLGASARMNTPSTKSGNWTWKLNSIDFLPELIENLKRLSQDNDRG